METNNKIFVTRYVFVSSFVYEVTLIEKKKIKETTKKIFKNKTKKKEASLKLRLYNSI